MTQQHGRRFEHDLVNGLTEVTTDDVWVAAVGWSGNSKYGGCDLVASVSPELATSHMTPMYCIEAKKRNAESGKRCSRALEGSADDESGLEELWRLVESAPSWADPVIALKFDHRELSVLDARWILDELGEMEFGVPNSVNLHEPRLTPSENVSMVKPTLDDWRSSQAAPDDAVVLAERLGIPYEVEDDG